jgi:hypothetical protein
MRDLYAQARAAFADYGGDRVFFVVAVSCVAHTMTFTILNLFFYVCHKYSLFEQYRIRSPFDSSSSFNSKTSKVLSATRHCHGVPERSPCRPSSHCSIVPLLPAVESPSSLLVKSSSDSLFEWRGVEMDAETIPPWYIIMFQILNFVWIEDTILYWTHRSMHHPLLYRAIHKVCVYIC